MLTMKHTFTATLTLLTMCAGAQDQTQWAMYHDILVAHYGTKPSGTPPKILWKPTGEDAKRFENYSSGNLETTVDTSFDVGGYERLVFFRTQVPREPDMVFCEACTDWIGLARMGYDDDQKPVKGEFINWFQMQGTLEGQPKPTLVTQNGWPIAVKIISYNGFMGQNTTEEQYFSFPEMKSILAVKTSEFIEERGGPNGPMSSLTQRSVRFIPEDNENTAHYEVEVTSTSEEGGAGSIEIWKWSEAEQKYVLKPAVPKPSTTRTVAPTKTK